MASKYFKDLTTGPVLKKLLLFALPICVSNMLQQLYHATDVMVVGKFAQDSTASLAAVGSTAHVTGLFVNLFTGLSIGANVLCANRLGEENKTGVRRAMHTALPLALIAGIFISLVGFFAAPTLLRWTGSPPEVIGEATLYMKIIFLGQPAGLLYNFGAGIMRAHGDTKRSMYILMTTGFINVLLNLLFVTVFHLDAAGVALATISAQYLSAATILFMLFRSTGDYRMRLKELRIHLEDMKLIVKVGVPAGLNAIVYNFSNVIVISHINALGAVSVAASSASTSISSIAHIASNSVSAACVSFAAQNYGAKNFKRIWTLYRTAVSVVFLFYLGVNLLFTFFPYFFLGLYTDSREVMEAGVVKLMLNNWGFMFSIFGEMANGCLRGLRKAGAPTFINMFSICGGRVLWLLLVYPFLPVQSLGTLCICYPISWAVSALSLFLYFRRTLKREEQAYLAASPA